MVATVLTTLEKVRIHLDIEGETDQDEQLKQMIQQVDEIISNETKRYPVPGSNAFSSVSAAEFYSGHGFEQLILNRRPPTTITRVSIDQAGFFGKPSGAFAAAGDWVEGTNFSNLNEDATEHNPGILIALGGAPFGAAFGTGGTWPKGRGNILVQYVAGYVTIPRDLEVAATQLVAALWNSSDMGLGGPVDNVRLGDLTYKLLSGDAGPDMLHVRSTLAKYKG